MWHKIIYLAFLPVAGVSLAEAQGLRNPLDVAPPYLSGNFGELRANHFHSGIDFKTQGEEGKSVHAVRDGYVCRIAVSPWGYGNVIYLAHPGDSIKTVYGHLQRFAGKIADYVREEQYAAERFSVDLTPAPEQFPVSRGDLVAFSGNTGGSGGPHLHFEVRDLQTDDPVDPLPFYEGRIGDTRPPGVRAVTVHPVEGQGAVNRSMQKTVVHRSGASAPDEPIEAWGKIGFSIRTDDRMDGTTNVYGVKEISMSVDGEELFYSFLDRFSFDETRFLNAWIDYETWREQGVFFTKTFVEPGNRLPFIAAKNRGYVMIDEPRAYHVLFRLTDAFGNSESLALEVIGKEQAIPLPDRREATPFFWRGENRFGAKGIRLSLPEKSLYANLYFRHAAWTDSAFFSDVHQLHDRPTPLHRPAQLSLFLVRDVLADKRRYGIVSLRNGRPSWTGGTWHDGRLDADIRELGIPYAVMADTIPPKITPVNPKQWAAAKAITFRITDNLSGVESYRGTVDGQYVLFEMDGKKALIKYTFDRQRLPPGTHALSLTVTDACGNTSRYETTF